MNDILPADVAAWQTLETALADVAHLYGYEEIRTPILEHTAVFTRGIGEVTDIVEREMYSFTDALNGEQLTLRPENTAAVVRSVIEHNLLYDGPKRLWYTGPMFRHERPQRGRYRQFYQFGIEALGFAGPDIDAEIILFGQRLWDDLGLANIRLELNTIGQPEERALHQAELVLFFERHLDALDDESRRRLYTNPLRLFDSKNPAIQALVKDAPQLIDFIGEESRAHFEGVQTLLKDAGVKFILNPTLVRGLDYYNLTVFEWITSELGAQGTLCGGGRYDPLIARSGGKAHPACGFGMGLERILELMRQQNVVSQSAKCDVYVVHQGVKAQRVAMRVAEGLRTGGFTVVLHCSPAGMSQSMKSQMKKADSSGATFAVLLGDDELAANELTVKALRDGAGGKQVRVPMGQITEFLIDATVADDQFDDDQ